MRRRGSGRVVFGAVAAIVAAMTWGCAALPTAPTPLDSTGTPQFVRVSSGGSGSFSVTPATGNTSSREINGQSGGTVSCGHFKLVVPPGAFAGRATVSLTVPDPSVMKCQLDVSSAGAQLLLPVLLEADCSSGVNVDPSSLVMMWDDVQNDRWDVVPGSSVSAATLVVGAPVLRCGSYGVAGGKAGW